LTPPPSTSVDQERAGWSVVEPKEIAELDVGIFVCEGEQESVLVFHAVHQDATTVFASGSLRVGNPGTSHLCDRP
jgi:hypothetical protein